MQTRTRTPQVDIVMAGTFAAWRLGTLQARALPFARELQARGIRCAIVTVPWDMPSESGVADTISNVELWNTRATGVTAFPLPIAQQIRLIRQLQPHAVHVFKPKGYGGLAGRYLSAGVPLLIDSDDWEGDGGWNQHGDYSWLQRRLFDWQERTLLQSARAVTAASYLLKHRARSFRMACPETVAWVPNGLDPDWASRLAAASYDTGQADSGTATIVLYSRFEEFPSDWLPRYLSRLSRQLISDFYVRIIVVGQTMDIDTGYKNLILEQMGYVAYERLPSILGRAAIAIYPYIDSLITRSKNSVKLLELMAARCAIVASRVGDITAVAGDSAVLVDGHEPEAFAAATVELLHNRQRGERLSSEAQRRALELFSVANSTNRLVEAYRNAGVVST